MKAQSTKNIHSTKRVVGEESKAEKEKKYQRERESGFFFVSVVK